MQSLIASAPKQKEFKLLPAESYPARCYSIIDLGTHDEDFQGELKEIHKIRITWEFPTELTTFDEEAGEQPFVMGKEFTLSLSDKANLRKTLESWRGVPFTDVELEGFDLRNILEKECLIQVIHKPGKSDPSKTYAVINSVNKLPKGMACPAQFNPSLFFVIDTDSFDQETFDSLPEFIKKKVMESKEYKSMFDLPEFNK